MPERTQRATPNPDGFNDHFSGVSRCYAAFRPSYPETLFTWLSDIAPATGEVWDCATGTGQAALGLVRHFRHVTATDASRKQIDAATPHPRISYRVAPAEASGLAAGTVDLITVAQALHWFDIGSFFREAKRVLVPEGVLAIWTYGAVFMENKETDSVLQEFFHSEMGPFWPAERALADSGYAGIELPLRELPSQAFGMSVSWTREELLGYIRTWSAVSRFIRVNGHDPVTDLEKKLVSHWHDGQRHRVSWPLSVRTCRA
ncbi:MAG: class I SAM-dependent methyltransferase [Chlorobi bacterium]|nr:class I SAM-dependent methyltransferase [Chlorobiota bacterium]